MAQYLITGSHGFIGSHLVARLEQLGHKVTRLKRNKLDKPKSLRKYITKINPEYVIHLAAYGNHYFQLSEYKTFKANVVGTFNLLWATRYLPYKGFANISTTKHNLESNTFYGSTKSSGEYLVRSFVRKYDLPVINIRPYSVYGEKEKEFRFIPSISKRISEGKSITVTDVSHDWIYVDDFIDGLLVALKESARLKGQSIGIGTGKRRWNREIARRLQAIAGRKVIVKKGTKRSYEIPFFNYAKTNIQEGLRKTYGHIEQRLKKTNN